MGKLLLLDGNALVHRAFHALPTLTSPYGELVNATYGFTAMLISAYREVRPDYVVAAFDTAAETFRKAEYADYKATRGPSPEGLSHQFQRVYQLLDLMGVPIFRLDGFEADDVLGTLALQASERGLEVVILTGDLDATQLVGPSVKVMAPVQGISQSKIYDEAGVIEKFGVEPRQVPDFKALRGDISDNIPGVPGIGDKTAAKLLCAFDSVDGILGHLDELPPKVRPLVEAHARQIGQSRRLAAIACDLPIQLDLVKAKTGRLDRQRLQEFFFELGFRAMIERLDSLAKEPSVRQTRRAEQQHLFQEEAQPQAPRSVAASERGRLITDPNEVGSWLRELRTAGPLELFLVAPGPSWRDSHLVGLSIGAAEAPPAYLPFGHANAANLDWERSRPALAELLEDASIPKIAHNAKHLRLTLGQHGVEVKGTVFDVMLAGYLLEAGKRTPELKELAYPRLQVDLPSLTSLTGAGKKATRLEDVPLETVAAFAVQHARTIGRLMPMLRRELEANRLLDLYQQVELPLVDVLAQMERNGICVDINYLAQLGREQHQKLLELEAAIYREVGHQFNVNSPQQLSQVLFSEMKLPSSRKTRTGQVSTGANVLEELRGVHPIVDMILEQRQLQKLKSTYVDALPLLADKYGRIHTSFNQTVAATGRLSSSDPNLQNIPIRTEAGRKVRKAFVSGGPDRCLVSADYSQIELRVLAHMTQDPTLMEAFASGQDIHAATASEVLGIPLESVNAEQRRVAKMVNFGVLYGMSGYGLAARTDLPQEDASAFIDRYFQRFGTIRLYQEQVIQEAERLGYATTLLGRRRYVPELRSPLRAVREAGIRQVTNLPIQGTAADIVKVAMIQVHEQLSRGQPSVQMLLQVHDELVFEAPRDALNAVVPTLRGVMESAMELSVQLRVDVKVGSNWDEMLPWSEVPSG